jgi:hypothetical protein
LKAPRAAKVTGPECPDKTCAAGNTEFLRDARWAKVFIPTITHALYVLREPFLDWTSESPALLAMVQHAFNLSFDNVTFTLPADDPIVETVRL